MCIRDSLLPDRVFPDFSHADKTKTNTFVTEPPTLECAGFEWYISGDKNRNATVHVSYRKKDHPQWNAALPMLRIGGEKIYGHEQRWVYTTEDMFAGSIFNLMPDTYYECKFKLSDPDGVDLSLIHI